MGTQTREINFKSHKTFNFLIGSTTPPRGGLLYRGCRGRMALAPFAACGRSEGYYPLTVTADILWCLGIQGLEVTSVVICGAIDSQADLLALRRAA